MGRLGFVPLVTGRPGSNDIAPGVHELTKAWDYGIRSVTACLPTSRLTGWSCARQTTSSASTSWRPPGTDSAELDQLLRAAGDGSDAWTRGLDGMLGYARSKGWMHGDTVAAHVETGE
jgi:hypothetical protein